MEHISDMSVVTSYFGGCYCHMCTVGKLEGFSYCWTVFPILLESFPYCQNVFLLLNVISPTEGAFSNRLLSVGPSVCTCQGQFNEDDLGLIILKIRVAPETRPQRYEKLK